MVRREESNHCQFSYQVSKEKIGFNHLSVSDKEGEMGGFISWVKKESKIEITFSNVDLYECVAEDKKGSLKYTTYDLLANIIHDGPPEAGGRYRTQILHAVSIFSHKDRIVSYEWADCFRSLCLSFLKWIMRTASKNIFEGYKQMVRDGRSACERYSPSDDYSRWIVYPGWFIGYWLSGGWLWTFSE